jgi:hypothetical protein
VYATQTEGQADQASQAGQAFEFGSSGFLFRSNKLMFDRRTNSLWHSLTGEPVVGRLAGSGIVLRQLPVVVTTWGQWKTDHPETKVLSLATGHLRPYYPGAAYGRYYASPDPMFPVWRRSAVLPAKSFVYGLQIGGVPKAYPLEVLEQERVTNDTLADQDVVLVTDALGRTVRAYQRADHTFRPGPTDRAIIDERGVPWTITEDALLRANGETAEPLPRLPGHISYWFGWFAFNPRTLVYGQ